MLPFIKRQGNSLVKRETVEVGGVPKQMVRAHAVVQRAAASPETWRKALAKLTNNGADMHVVLVNLALGNAYRPQVIGPDGNPTGQVMELIVPTPEVRRASAHNVHEMLHGKAVAETELVAAEAEASKMRQLESMSDLELERYIEGDYTVLSPGESIPEEGTPRNATEKATHPRRSPFARLRRST
jgi:hypothetical protein